MCSHYLNEILPVQNENKYKIRYIKFDIKKVNETIILTDLMVRST